MTTSTSEPAPGPGQPRLVFRRRHRLTHAREYRAAYAHKLRKSAGPLTVFLVPTDRDEPRLGLAVGRRVGRAVDRTRTKRLIREAFRMMMPTLPSPPGGGSYDVVVAARWRLADLARCRELLGVLVDRAHREQVKRTDREAGKGAGS